MKRKLYRLSAIFIFFETLISCNAQPHYNHKYSTERNQTFDTVIKKDIPLDKKGSPRSYYRNKKAVEEKLGIATLENGFDSLQIRIWYGYAFNDSSQLIILKNVTGKWSGELFSLIYMMNQEGDSIESINKVIVNGEPKSGWKYLIEKIINLNILTLPDYHTLSDYNQTADGDAVIIEVSTKNVYRIYSYQEPHMFQDKHWQAKNMEQILGLIEEEFNFKRLRKL